MGKLANRIKKDLKTTAKNFASGNYKVTDKLNRVGVAARNTRNDIINDFNSDGPNFGFHAEHESPFRMPNNDVLPAFQGKSREHREKRHKRHSRKKVVYFY